MRSSRTSTAFTVPERRAVLSLASLYAFRMFGLFMVLPVLALYAHELEGSTPLLLGLALGVYGLSQAVLQIPFGVWSDRWGRKPVIVAGLVLFSVGSLVAAAADSIYGVIFGRALQGGGAIAATVMALASELTREETRSKAMAVIGASIGLSFTVALILGPPVSRMFGLSGLFLVTFTMGVIGILLVLYVVPDPAESGLQHQEVVPGVALFRRVVRDVELMRLNAGIFVLHLGLTALFVVLPLVLRDHLGLPREQHWKVYLPVMLGAFVVMMPFMMAAERRGRQKLSFLGAVLGLALANLLLAAFHTQGAVVVALLALYFFAFNLLEASLPSLVSRMCPPGGKGAAMGIYSTSQFLGAFAGGAVGGWCAQHFGWGSVFAVCGVACALWAWLAWPMRIPALSRSVVVALAGAPAEPEALAGLRGVPGVLDVLLMPREGVAYLKVDDAAFDPGALPAYAVVEA